MKPETQRTAIAEACGLHFEDREYQTARPQSEMYRHGGWYKDDVFIGDLPDYLNDLNAMHEAEAYARDHLMDAGQWEKYGINLQRMHPSAIIIQQPDESPDYYDFATLMVEVTAAQRAEAFLQTLGLWK